MKKQIKPITAETYLPEPHTENMSDEETALVQEAADRFKIAYAFEDASRKNMIEDYKFVNGDAYNNYQWPNSVLVERRASDRVTMTINKTRQHVRLVVNSTMRNMPGSVVRPKGGPATVRSAEIVNGIIRDVEAVSAAPDVYSNAYDFSVKTGVGHWRIDTQYVDDESFDQEPAIRAIQDQFSVYSDPYTLRPDKLDRRYLFIVTELDKTEFEHTYPNVMISDAGPFSSTALRTKEGTFVLEYYRLIDVPDRIAAGVDPMTSKSFVERESKLGAKVFKELISVPGVRVRDTKRTIVEWFLIGGNRIIKSRRVVGKYIPIVTITIEETIIDGILDRKGHVRHMIDAQRSYNYWTSSSTELGALQTKTPYVAPKDAVSGYEDQWANANLENKPYLPYNHVDEDGRPIPPPQRQAPPQMSAAYIQGLQTAQNEMMMTSGQYQSHFGQIENARSGVAIQQRQEQSEVATADYPVALSRALRANAEILLSMIPELYDTERVVRYYAPDGKNSFFVKIDPNAEQSFEELGIDQEPSGNSTTIGILNPSIGRYEVVPDSGLSFTTRRQNGFAALMELSRTNPQVMGVAGDLMFHMADFPEADKLAERWRRTIPPNISGEELPVQVQQAMEESANQIEQLRQVVQKQQEELESKEAELEIRRYEAQTKRLATNTNSINVAPEVLLPLVIKTVEEAGAPAMPSGSLPQFEAPVTGDQSEFDFTNDNQ